MWDMVGNVSAGGGIAGWLCVCSGVGGRVWLVYASVMHSSSDPGGGLPVMAAKNEGDARGTSPCDARGTSPVGIVVVYGIAFVAGAGGGSNGGRAVVHATDGGSTTAVRP
jgi:hypothetical protein